MKDEKFLKSMSCIYQGMECLNNIEMAYLLGDMSTCKLLTNIYPQLAELEGDEMPAANNMSARVKNAKELYYWCSEDIDDNVIVVLHDEYKYWVGQFELICKEFLARLNYDASTITQQMQLAFFEALFTLIRRLNDGAYLKSVAEASESVIVKATSDMLVLWREVLNEYSAEEPIGRYVSGMMNVLQQRGYSKEEVLDFFKLLDIHLDIIQR